MARRTVLHSHTSSRRDHWWFLVQDGDGTLHVEVENDDAPEEGRQRYSINEFLTKSAASGPRDKLMKLVERMFQD